MENGRQLICAKLIVRLARENPGWGYTRIVGELKKLEITGPSRGTVRNILREQGLAPAPKRGDSTWDEFLKLHPTTLWQADFLSVRSLTTKGVLITSFCLASGIWIT